MKRIDSILTWTLLTLTSAYWIWSQFFGLLPTSLHLLPIFLSAGILFYSYRGRKHWVINHDLRMKELETVMTKYHLLSDQAMAYAETEFSWLEKEMDVALKTIQESVYKLSGSLTGLERHSNDQRHRMKSLIDEMLQMTNTDVSRHQEQVGLQRFFDETHLLINEFVSKMSELKEASTGIAISFDHMQGKVLRIGAYLHSFLRLHHDRDQIDGLQRFQTRINRLTDLMAEAEKNINKQSIEDKAAFSSVDLF